jgi:HTH-type transcriptional regulator/antitoxin HigA
MTVAAREFDAREYGRLLAATLPSVVENDDDLERLTEEINRFVSKGEGNLSAEEDRLLSLLVRLVEDYETEHHPIPDAPPHEMLQFR